MSRGKLGVWFINNEHAQVDSQDKNPIFRYRFQQARITLMPKKHCLVFQHVSTPITEPVTKFGGRGSVDRPLPPSVDSGWETVESGWGSCTACPPLATTRWWNTLDTTAATASSSMPRYNTSAAAFGSAGESRVFTLPISGLRAKRATRRMP